MIAELPSPVRTNCPIPEVDESIPLPETLSEWDGLGHIAALDDDDRVRLLPYAFDPYAEATESNRFLIHDESGSIVCVVTVVTSAATPDVCEDAALTLLQSCDEYRHRDLTVWLVETWMEGRPGTKVLTNRDGEELFSVRYGGKPITRLSVR